MSKVSIDREALRKILEAVTGEPHLIRELQATMSLPGSPVMQVVRDFNASVTVTTIMGGLFGGEDD